MCEDELHGFWEPQPPIQALWLHLDDHLESTGMGRVLHSLPCLPQGLL